MLLKIADKQNFMFQVSLNKENIRWYWILSASLFYIVDVQEIGFLKSSDTGK